MHGYKIAEEDCIRLAVHSDGSAVEIEEGGACHEDGFLDLVGNDKSSDDVTPHKESKPTADLMRPDVDVAGDGTVSPSDLELKKVTQAVKTKKMIKEIEDLAEVVIFVHSPKKGKKSTSTTPLASPMKKMSMASPKTPQSPLKRKRPVIRDSSEECSAMDASDGAEETMMLKGVPLPNRSPSPTHQSPKKVKAGRLPSSPRKVAEKLSPKIKVEAKVDAIAEKTPAKRAPKKGKAKDVSKTSDGDDEDNANSPRKIKKPCVWTEAEINVIGQHYIQVMSTVTPNALKAGLEEIWDENPSLRKTAKDLSNHLAKWRKAFQALPATILPH